jgi:hypothetical protein
MAERIDLKAAPSNGYKSSDIEFLQIPLKSPMNKTQLAIKLRRPYKSVFMDIFHFSGKATRKRNA